MLVLSDVTRTSIVRSLTDRELPLAVEGYMVYCRGYVVKIFNQAHVTSKLLFGSCIGRIKVTPVVIIGHDVKMW